MIDQRGVRIAERPRARGGRTSTRGIAGRRLGCVLGRRRLASREERHDFDAQLAEIEDRARDAGADHLAAASSRCPDRYTPRGSGGASDQGSREGNLANEKGFRRTVHGRTSLGDPESEHWRRAPPSRLRHILSANRSRAQCARRQGPLRRARRAAGTPRSKYRSGRRGKSAPKARSKTVRNRFTFEMSLGQEVRRLAGQRTAERLANLTRIVPLASVRVAGWARGQISAGSRAGARSLQ